MQNKVLSILKVKGQKLVHRQVPQILAPNSGRSYMPSGTSLISFPKEDRDFLGGPHRPATGMTGQVGGRSSTCLELW